MKEFGTGILFILLPILGSGICTGIEEGNVSLPLVAVLAAIMLTLYRIGRTNP